MPIKREVTDTGIYQDVRVSITDPAATAEERDEFMRAWAERHNAFWSDPLATVRAIPLVAEVIEHNAKTNGWLDRINKAAPSKRRRLWEKFAEWKRETEPAKGTPEWAAWDDARGVAALLDCLETATGPNRDRLLEVATK